VISGNFLTGPHQGVPPVRQRRVAVQAQSAPKAPARPAPLDQTAPAFVAAVLAGDLTASGGVRRHWPGWPVPNATLAAASPDPRHPDHPVLVGPRPEPGSSPAPKRAHRPLRARSAVRLPAGPVWKYQRGPAARGAPDGVSTFHPAYCCPGVG
jgi:hypothetical protein